MHTKDILEKVAQKHHTTVIEVWTEIQKVIDLCYDSTDPKVKKEWRKICANGKKPTSDELLFYLTRKMSV